MKKKILLRTKAHFSHFGTVLTSKEYSSDTDLLLSSETVQRHIIPSESSHIKTISVASKMNHVCYEHFLIRPAYETAPTDQQEFSHINLISNTICSLKLTIFYLIMTRPCQPGYQKINTSIFVRLWVQVSENCTAFFKEATDIEKHLLLSILPSILLRTP